MCDGADGRAAHRHPLACLQTEFYRELEDDGRIGSHLPLQLPVPQILILMVRYQDLLSDTVSADGYVSASKLSPRQLCC